jgi:excisionase family DNA binding protein
MKAQKENIKVNDIYSPKTVAELLEVKESFVKRLLRDGEIKGFKLGKFWRMPQESLDDYCASCGNNGNGNHRASEDMRNKIKFHANLRSGVALPNSFERLTSEISRLKEDLRAEKGHKKVALIAKMQMAVTLREQTRRRIEGLDNELTDLGAKAYPDVADLVDTNPDTLEEIFTGAANEPKKSLLDYLDKKVIEELKGEKIEGAAQGEELKQAAE